MSISIPFSVPYNTDFIEKKPNPISPRHGLPKAHGGFELRTGGADGELQGTSRKEAKGLRALGIWSSRDLETLISLVSRDRFKGKVTGTHGFDHETLGLSDGFFTTNSRMAVSSTNILS